MSSREHTINEREWIQAFLKNRSEENFLRIYRRYVPDLYRFAMHLTNYHQAETEDIVQETWLIAVQKLNNFEYRSSLKTWLSGILFNKWRERRSRSVNHTTMEENKEEQIGEDHAARITDRMDLQKAIGQLADGYREVLILYDAEGYKHREIAEILGISEGTSKSQLFHARKAMQELLRD